MEIGDFSPLSGANARMMMALIPNATQQGPGAISDSGMPSVGTVLPKYKQTVATIPKIGAPKPGEPEPVSTTSNDTGDWFTKLINEPFIKIPLNVLSTPVYTVGNILDSTGKALEKENQNRAEGKPYDADNVLGDWLYNATVGAVQKGIGGGILQKPEDAVMPSTALERAREASGMKPPQNTAEKVAQGVLGFGLDMALDPLSYTGGGLAVAAGKGFVKGAQEARIAGQLAKEGSEAVDKTPMLDNALATAKQYVSDYRQGLKDQRAASKAARTNAAPEDYSETIPGFLRAPDKIDSGDTASITASDIAQGSTAKLDNPTWLPLRPEDIKPYEGWAADVDNQLSTNLDYVTLPKTPTVGERAVSERAPIVPKETAPDMPKADQAIVPDIAAKVHKDEIVTNLPPLVKSSDYERFTPADRFTMLTEPLVGQQAKYTGLKAKNLNDYFNVPHEDQVDWLRLSNDLINAGKDSVVTSPVNGSKMSANALGDYIFDAYSKAKGGPVTLSPKIAPHIPEGLIQGYTRHVPAEGAELPTLDRAVQLGLDPNDFVHAIRDGGVHNIKVPTGNLNTILNQMSRGEIPVSDQFLEGMRALSENPKLTAEDAVQAAREFSKINREAIEASMKSFGMTATDGRLSMNKLSGSSSAVGLKDAVDPETYQALRTPFRPEEAQAIHNKSIELAQKAIDEGPHADFLNHIVDDILTKNIQKQITPLGEFKTNRGFSTATASELDGGAKLERVYTTASAIDTFTNLNKAVTDYLLSQGIRGGTHAALKENMVMRGLSRIDAEMKEYGVFPYLTNMMPKGGVPVRLSMYDVLSVLPQDVRRKWLFPRNPLSDNPRAPASIQHVRPSQLMDVAEMIVRTMVDNGGEIKRSILKPEVIKALKGEFGSENTAREIAMNLDVPTNQFNLRVIESVIKSAKPYLNNPAKANAAREKLFGDIYETFTREDATGHSLAQDLAERVLRNNALHGDIMARRLKAMSDETMQRLTDTFMNKTPGDMHELIASLKPMNSVAEPEAAELGNQIIGGIKNEFATPMEQIHTSASLPNINLGDKWKTLNPDTLSGKKLDAALKNQINANNAERLRRTGNPDLHPDAAPALVEKVGNTDVILQLSREDHAFHTVLAMHPFMRFFVKAFNMSEGTYHFLTSGVHFGAHMEAVLTAAVSKLGRDFKPDELMLAFRGIKNGEERTTPAMTQLGSLLDSLFDSSAHNVFSRNGITRDHINDLLDGMRGVPIEWRFNHTDPELMAQEWRTWDNIENPLAFIRMMHTALMKASENIHMGARFSQLGLREIPKGEAGQWVKIDMRGSTNKFARLIDTSLYYPKELVKDLPAINRIMLEKRTFGDTWLGEWINKVFDPMISALKLTETTIKPGHHIMSIAGDMLRNSLAGMNLSMKEYWESYRLLSSRRDLSGSLGDLGEFARLTSNERGITMVADKTAKNNIRFTNIGNNIPKLFSMESMFSAMEAKGIILPTHGGGIAEDFLSKPGEMGEASGHLGKIGNIEAKIAGGFNNSLQKATNNRLIHLNDWTADRDNWPRVALALWAMRSKHFASMDEALDHAAVVLRKWAPTAKDFAAAESKYLRRIVFYYTWQRGILPRIIEQSVIRPGWALAPSKAAYNMAEVNGTQPASLGDPFPQNVTIPQYYRNMVLGPQWISDDGHYWGFNPTSPVLDTLNTLGSGATIKNMFMMNPFDPSSGEAAIGKTLVGMTNPFIRGTVETVTGTNVQTQAPIKDIGQYWQDYLGPARYLSKVTGHDFVSTDGILPRRTEAKYKNGIGSEQDWWNNLEHETTNYMTGLQFRDYTSPEAIKNAQFEQKDQKKQAKENLNRNAPIMGQLTGQY